MAIKLIYIVYILSLNFLEIFAQEKIKVFEPNNGKNLMIADSFNKRISSLKWEREDINKIHSLKWEKINNETKNSLIKNLNSIGNSRKVNKVKALDRSIVFNKIHYPEISHYVPNGYVSFSDKSFTTSLRTISKLRHCEGKNFESKCADGIFNLDLNLFNSDSYSLNTKFSLQSISNRGTSFGEESSLGFKFAKEISPNWSFAVGGENLIHFDNTIDLGRNYYLIASTFKQIGSSKKEYPSILFLNIGIGSDFYGYKGNGFLWRAPCLGEPNLTGDKENKCSWGPIGSIALAPNNRLSFVTEWFGYSYGSGFSIKPFKEQSLILSLYATDFIKGFPKYAEEYCPKNKCSPRFYGNISLSF
jgi:hypothetical protein